MKRLITIFILLAICYSAQSQKEKDPLKLAPKAIVSIEVYNSAGQVTDNGAGVVIDSAGNTVTLYQLVDKADKIKITTKDGKSQFINEFNGLDYEGGIVRFKLQNNPGYFIPLPKEKYSREEFYILDITKDHQPIKGSLKKERLLRHYGKTLRFDFNNLGTGNSGNAILNTSGELVALAMQNNDDKAIIGMDAMRIKKIQPFKEDKFNKEYYKGMVSLSKENYKDAYQFFNSSLEKDPYNAKALTRRGEIKLAYEDYLGAIDDFNKVLFLETKDDYAFYNIGMAYYHLRQYNICTDWFSNAIKFNPNNKFAYKMRGETKYLLGSVNAAMVDLGKALELDEDYGDAYYIRGICKAGSKKSKRSACQDLNKARMLGTEGADKAFQQYCK